MARRTDCFCLRGFVAALLMVLATLSFAQGDPLRQASELVRQGKAQAALELLRPLRAQYAQSAEYHYFIGVAALDAGDPDAAIADLKEALRLKPDLAQARAELGRAHLRTGHWLAAHLAFDEVRRSNPPPEVIASIDRLVEDVHVQVNVARKRFQGNVTIGLGYDSNVASATSAQQVTLPILGGIVSTLSPAARARSDSFTLAGIEAGGFVPLNDATEFFGAGRLHAKINDDIDAFDYLTGFGVAGVRHDFGPNQVSVSGSFDSVTLDNQRVRDALGLNVEWRRIVHPLAEISAFGQFSTLDYPKEPFRDARREVFGVAVNPVAFGKRLFNLPPVASLYWGSERPTASGVEHLGHRLIGARAAFFWQMNTRLSLFGAASFERREYGAPDPLFLVTRIDKQSDLSAGLLYSLNKDWLLTPAISYTDNRSSMDVFKYERTAITLVARYSF